MTAPSLIFAWGNPSRGDDAIGPLFVERLEALAALHPERYGFECLTDFQLQVEHALDLRDRARVLFVDASLSCAAPFEVSALLPARDMSFTSHAMTPQAVLQVYVELNEGEPPSAQMLAIRGERFLLGEDLSAVAEINLAAAFDWTLAWLGSQEKVDMSPSDFPRKGDRDLRSSG